MRGECQPCNELSVRALFSKRRRSCRVVERQLCCGIRRAITFRLAVPAGPPAELHSAIRVDRDHQCLQLQVLVLSPVGTRSSRDGRSILHDDREGRAAARWAARRRRRVHAVALDARRRAVHEPTLPRALQGGVQVGLHRYRLRDQRGAVHAARLLELPSTARYTLGIDYCADPEYFERVRGTAGSWARVRKNVLATLAHEELRHIRIRLKDISSFSVVDPNERRRRFKQLQRLFSKQQQAVLREQDLSQCDRLPRRDR